jgi:hypothetical protein
VGERDVVNAFLLRATSEHAARLYAATRPADEGEETWTNPLLSSCEEVTADGPDGIILRALRPA